MDQDRQVRFLIPPFFMLTSLLLGAYLDCRIDLLVFLQPDTLKNLVAILTATAISVIPMGFTISVLSTLWLRLFFWSFCSGNYEALVPDDCLERIWPRLEVGRTRHGKDVLYAVATFDHELLSQGIHQWVRRRWNSFNVSMHSFTALIMSHIVGTLVFKINLDLRWILCTGIVSAGLMANGYFAWRDTMAMLNFQSYRQTKSAKPNAQ